MHYYYLQCVCTCTAQG